MQVVLEAINEQGRQLTITVPSAVFEKRIKKRLREVASEAQLKGHRRGKAPLKEVRRQLGKVIRQEVANNMAREHTTRVMLREGLEPTDGAEAEIKNMKAGDDLQFVVTFRVLRDIELGDFAKIVVREPKVEITDEDVEQEIYGLRVRSIPYREVQRPAREGDRVTVSHVTIVDGVRSSPTDDQQIRIMPDKYKDKKELRLLARYAQVLTGTRPGDVRVVPFGLFRDDEDVAPAESAEEDAHLEFTVKKVEAGELPELDAEFLSSLGIPDGDMGKLRAMMRGRMVADLRTSVARQVKQQVTDALVGMHDIPLPEARVREEILREKDRVLDVMWDAQRGSDADMEEEQFEEEFGAFIEQAEDWPDEPFREPARKNVTLGLVLEAIVKTHSLTPDETRVRQRIDELAQDSENPERVAKLMYGDERVLENVHEHVLDAQAIEHALAAATIVPVPCSYEDAMSGSITAPPDAKADGEASGSGPFDRHKP